MLDSMRYYFRQMRGTDWRRFFQKNGPRQFDEVKFTGWRQSQNELMLHAQIIGHISSTRDHYYIAASAPWDRPKEVLDDRELDMRASLDGYLHPDCRCRLGFHWKCSVHYRWFN